MDLCQWKVRGRVAMSGGTGYPGRALDHDPDMAPLVPSIRLVPAAAGHRAFVRRLSAEVFGRFGDYDRILPDLMARPWVRTTVAEARQGPVGFVMISFEDRSRGEVDLAAIAVEPSWQARGLGRVLLAHVESEASRLAGGGFETTVRLSVAEDNLKARRLFAAAGYAPVPGEEGSYPAGQPSLTLRKVVERRRLDSAPSRQELE